MFFYGIQDKRANVSLDVKRLWRPWTIATPGVRTQERYLPCLNSENFVIYRCVCYKFKDLFELQEAISLYSLILLTKL